jgi:hypothetical protein
VTGAASRARLGWALAGVAVLWAAAFGLTLLPLPWVGARVGLALALVSWSCILLVVVLLGRLSRRRWVTVTSTALTVVLAAVLLNWSSVASAAWFETRRALFDHAARTVETDDSYYGVELPVLLRPLSASGRVRRDESGLFFPQWLGIPDDAGGYFYAPGRAPEGAEMYGTLCLDPSDLGGGWWVCGMEDQ